MEQKVNNIESQPKLDDLRRRVAGIGRARPGKETDRVRLCVEAIDLTLGGGLSRACVHELFALRKEDAASAAGFAAMLGVRLGGTVAWLQTRQAHAEGGRLYAPGLLDIGLNPARLFVAALPDALSVLRAANDIARCPEVSVCVVELWQRCPDLDLTATRRLVLAAENSSSTVLLLRIAAEPVPSAAETRWSVKSADSAPLDVNAPGHPALTLELLRQRGRPAGQSWRVEWDRDQLSFQEQTVRPPISRPMVPLSFHGPNAAGAGLRRAAG